MGRHVLVTGANRGLGLEYARQLSARGDSVMATARDVAAARALRSLPVTLEALDVTVPESVAALAGKRRGRPLDLLVNNAGVGVGGRPLGALDYPELRSFYETNALGPLRMVEALLPELRADGGGVVVNMTSRMGSIADNSSGGSYAYRASKAALNMITRSLALDLREAGVICVVVHPGWVQTAMGGSAAPTTVEASVSGLLRVIDRLGPEDSGAFFDYTGERLPW